MGWFMIEFEFSGNRVLVDNETVFKNVQIFDEDGDYVLFIPNEIDDLIAALQKAKAIMAIDKSK